MYKKEEDASAGIILAAWGVIVLGIVLTIFIAIPIFHYIGSWYSYWNDDSSSTHSETRTPEESARRYRQITANTSCYTRAKTYFKTDQVSAYADSKDDYTVYDCYGVKYTKIP